MKCFDVGDLVTLATEVRDRLGNLATPSTVTLVVRKPDGTEDSYSPAPDGTGLFHEDIDADADGFWTYRWTVSGGVKTSDERVFFVRERRVP